MSCFTVLMSMVGSAFGGGKSKTSLSLRSSFNLAIDVSGFCVS